MITFRKRKRHNIIGTPLSQVSKELAENQLTKLDLMMLSQPDTSIDQLNSGYYKSKSIEFGELEKKLSSDVFNALGLGDIAYENPDNYSKAVHCHSQYSHIEVESFCSNRRAEDNALCSIVTFETNGISENMSISAFNELTVDGTKNLQLGPKIGEMRLFCTSSYDNIVNANNLIDDVNNDMFSGWILPNGQEIDKDKFPEAYKIFGSNLPIIDDYFMKLNPFLYNVESDNNSTAIENGIQTAAAVHQHTANNGILEYEDKQAASKGIDFYYKLQYNVGVDTTYDWSNAVVDNCKNALEYGFIACECTSKTMAKVEVQVMTTIDVNNMNVVIDDSLKQLEENPTTPSYTNVIALIYIGKPYKQQIGQSTDGLLPDSSYQQYIT